VEIHSASLIGRVRSSILYETLYELPSIGFRQRALTGVTYTHEGGRWLAIADQGTPLP
jgi:hypothetical protein